MELLTENVQRYFDFCQERHAIYLRRQAGEPWPWTDDEILRTYKFTNIYRELDKGTVWLREHIIEPYADHPHLDFNIALYRRYNYWPMAQYLSSYFYGLINCVHFVEDLPFVVKKYRDAGNQVFTGAHMINCPKPYTDKVDYVFGDGAENLWRVRVNFDVVRTLEDAFNAYLKYSGIGRFIAYEIVTDLRHTHYLKNAPDIMTWANPGPGAQRGLLRLAGLPIRNQAGLPKHDWKYPNDFIAGMRALLELSKQYLPDWMPAWEMREVEHSLCEFDKYERARLGEGRPRAKYHHEA